MIKDPTKTLVLRRRAAKEVNRRFNNIKRAVRSAFKPGGLMTNIRLASPNEFTFVRDAEMVPAFNRFLQEQIDFEILRIEGFNPTELAMEDHWLNRHVGEGYRRGAVKTRLAAERAMPNMLKLPDFNPFANPAHVTRSELIFQRVFSDLEGVTQTMSKQMSRVLGEGMLQGKNPKVVAKEMMGRIDAIGKTRANLIARTEIIEAHNTANITEAEQLEKDTGVEIKMKWLTAMDGRQRHAHGERNGKVYTRKRAQELIGEPNCRCGLTPEFDL